MMRKQKGSAAERELLHMFWENGYAALRVAGSGSTTRAAVDIIAGKPGRTLAIECKATLSDVKYFSQEDIDQIKVFSQTFGAEGWIGVKFNRFGWRFFSLEDVSTTKSGFKVSKDLAQLKGLLFEEIL